MQQWEYNDVIIGKDEDHATIERLDAAGLEGWEFFGLVQETPHVKIYMVKRPLEPATEVPSLASVKHAHSWRLSCTRSCEHYGTANEIIKSSFL